MSDENVRAVYDEKLPVFVRASLILLDLPATEKFTLKSAGMFPPLYAKYQGVWCRVNLFSRLGDLGINYNLDHEFGYNRRDVSIYELTDYTMERPIK